MITSILVNGLVCAGIYGLLALGFSLTFGVAKILNMAHTGFYMVAAFFLYVGTNLIGLPLLSSALLAIVITGILGLSSYKLFFDRIKEHEAAVVIVSLALAILFQEVLLLTFGGHYRNVRAFAPGFYEVSNIRVSYQHLLTSLVSLISLGIIWVILRKTRIGITIRAVAEDREIANLMGINVSQWCMITFGISVILAGIAATLVAPIFMVHPLMWTHPLVIVLAAVVLGGLDSIKGAVIGALILGLAENVIASIVPGGSFLRGAFSLSIMVIILMIRPEGLFGTAFEEERL